MIKDLGTILLNVCLLCEDFSLFLLSKIFVIMSKCRLVCYAYSCLPKWLHLLSLSYNLQEFANVNGKLAKGKGSRKNAKVEVENLIISNSRSKNGNWKSGSPKLNSQTKKESLQKHQRVESRVKEEGEISESEPENYEQYKEEKWMEWCADVMEEEEQTLTRLERLQSTSLNLPKEKVVVCLILACNSLYCFSFDHSILF